MRRRIERSAAWIVALVLLVGAGAAAAQQGGVPFGVPGEHDADEPVEITADSLDVDQLAGTATFRGAVVVGQGALRLAASEVEVTYGEDAAGATAIRLIRATGAVTITNGAEAAEGARALYRVEDGVIELEGDVVLTQGPNAVAGDRLRIDLASGRGVMEGRVQTIIVPGTEGGLGPGLGGLSGSAAGGASGTGSGGARP